MIQVSVLEPFPYTLEIAESNDPSKCTGTIPSLYPSPSSLTLWRSQNPMIQVSVLEPFPYTLEIAESNDPSKGTLLFYFMSKF
jgi:hypothetical protein